MEKNTFQFSPVRIESLPCLAGELGAAINVALDHWREVDEAKLDVGAQMIGLDALGREIGANLPTPYANNKGLASCIAASTRLISFGDKQARRERRDAFNAALLTAEALTSVQETDTDERKAQVREELSSVFSETEISLVSPFVLLVADIPSES